MWPLCLSLGVTFTNSFIFMLGETNCPQWNESRACCPLSESHSERTFVQWTCVCVSDRDGYNNKACNISHHPLLLESFSCPSHQSSGNSLTLLFPVFIIMKCMNILKISMNRWNYEAEIIYVYVRVFICIHLFIRHSVSRFKPYCKNIYLFICVNMCVHTYPMCLVLTESRRCRSRRCRVP